MPASQASLSFSNDSIASFYGGLGDPSRDKAAGAFYYVPFLSALDFLNMYRGSWLSRKIVDIPADDAVRAWREWKADKAEIEKIEAEEKRLQYRQKIRLARGKARLFGGGGVFIGTGEAQGLDLPIEPERCRNEGIKYLTALSSNELRVAELEFDPISPNYGKPKMYRVGVTGGTATLVDIHPSRVIAFSGIPNPEPRFGLPGMSAYGWGDSILQSVYDAVRNSDSGVANMASLLFEANVDVFGVPDMISQMADPAYQNLLTERFSLAAANKAINKAIIRDAAETYERKGVVFNGAPELLELIFKYNSGGADIPMTRLFGQSPAGMSATGESDMRNYYDGINSGQELDMTPAMSIGDECLVWSAGLQPKPDLTYEWSPLWQMSDVERATVGKTDAETAKIIFDTGLVPSEALAKALVNQLTEHGVYPGLEQFVDELPEIDFEKLDNPPEPVIVAPPGGAKPKPATTDATPQTLYISRKVKNASAITAWARKAGLSETLAGDELHVTIAFSRDPVDWMALGEAWSSEIKIAAGGPRMVEQFDQGAIVLLFKCSELQWRHDEVLRKGGSWEHDEFQPHITVSYRGALADLSAIEPYQGEIILGPEIFQKVVEDWSKIRAA